MKKNETCNQTAVNKKPGKKIIKSLKAFKNHKINDTVKIRKVKIRNGTNYKKNHIEHKNKTVDNHKRNIKTFVKDHVKLMDSNIKVVQKAHQ